MMLKDLKDYINSLDLNEVQSNVVIVSYDQANDGAKGHANVSVLADFNLCLCDDRIHRPYLSLYTEDFVDSLEVEDDCG